MTANLKSCPFCGNKVKFAYDADFVPYGVTCSTCHMVVKFMRIGMKKGEKFEDVMNRMADIWNRRS